MQQVFEFKQALLPDPAEGMLGIETLYQVPKEPIRQAAGIVLPQALHAAVPLRQVEYLAGRACAVEACRLLGLAAAPPATGPNREPIWPGGVTGSISHSHGQALSVVSSIRTCRSIGVDIEHIVDRQKAESLFSMIATTAEAEHLLALTNGSLELAFTLVFCAKEAIFKATWPLVRRFINFDEAILIAGQPGYLTFAPCASLAADLGLRELPAVTYKTTSSTVTTLCWYGAN